MSKNENVEDIEDIWAIKNYFYPCLGGGTDDLEKFSSCLFSLSKIKFSHIYCDYLSKRKKGERRKQMKFRHEFKHEITEFDYLTLRSRLNCTVYPDKNGDNGKYKIRSLYFDNLYDSALREKLDGVNCREKFRIRSYNGSNDFIRLEKKSKINGLCNKVSGKIQAEEVKKIVLGDLDFMEDSQVPLIRELYYKMKHQGLAPKTIVDYTREAFTYPAGNVRITLDYDIRTGLSGIDFLDDDCVTIPAGDKVIILEVKWDEFLPDFVRDMVQMEGRKSSAFSKYAACRIYG